MNDNKSPYAATKWEWTKPLHVKEWTIKKLKEGVSAPKLVHDIKKLFGVDVTVMNIYRWRNRYTTVTGERIPYWHELNPTAEQKRKNMLKKPKI